MNEEKFKIIEQKLEDLATNQKNLPSEFNEIINKCFFELISGNWYNVCTVKLTILGKVLRRV